VPNENLTPIPDNAPSDKRTWWRRLSSLRKKQTAFLGFLI
jgi:hypothetical protein